MLLQLLSLGLSWRGAMSMGFREALSSGLQQAYVSRLHRVAVATTGAGGTAGGYLLGVPGASGTIVEVSIPYATSSSEEYLSRERVPPPSDGRFSGPDMADQLATAALRRALRLGGERNGAGRTVGVGCAAAIVSDTPRRGSHHAHLSVHTLSEDASSVCVRRIQLEMEKGLRTRSEEDDLVGMLVAGGALEAVDGAFSVVSAMESVVSSGDALSSAAAAEADALAGVDAVLSGAAPHCLFLGRGATLGSVAPWQRRLVVSGSFNPLHSGHLRMCDAALLKWRSARGESLSPLFELAATNADKGGIGREEAARRLSQFRGAAMMSGGEQTTADAVLTGAALFSEKARVLPGSVFLIGADTLARLLEEGYYGGTRDGVVAALQQLKDSGCAFVVAGRESGGAFEAAEDVLEAKALPEGLREMFVCLTEDEFRVDLSSTEVRAGSGAERS